MRLDRFLWWARLTKTRAAAQALAAAGRLRIDGRPVARAHVDVRIGNVLTYMLHDRVHVVRVEALPLRRGPSPEARSCYSDMAAAPSHASANVSQEDATD